MPEVFVPGIAVLVLIGAEEGIARGRVLLRIVEIVDERLAFRLAVVRCKDSDAPVLFAETQVIGIIDTRAPVSVELHSFVGDGIRFKIPLVFVIDAPVNFFAVEIPAVEIIIGALRIGARKFAERVNEVFRTLFKIVVIDNGVGAVAVLAALQMEHDLHIPHLTVIHGSIRTGREPRRGAGGGNNGHRGDEQLPELHNGHILPGTSFVKFPIVKNLMNFVFFSLILCL